MPTVILSPKFQVVLPKEVRQKVGLRPGQRIQVIAYDDRIELIPVQPVEKMRGFLEGIDTRLTRDEDRV